MMVSEGGLFAEVQCVEWVEGRDGVVGVVCVGSVRDGRRGHGMCV